MARLQVAIESSDSVFTQSRWRGHFELAKWEAITSNSASADGVLHERLDTLVPAKVTEEDFWRNYLVFVAALRLQLVRHVQNLPEEKQSSGTNVRFSIGDELADEDDDTNAGSVSRDRPATESTYASRLSSFNVTHDTPGGGKIDWPKAQMDAIGVTAERLAAAGLEFAPKPGAEDRCLCRACGIDLHSWEEGDDPFAEHSRWAFEAGKSCLRVELLQCGADEGLSWTDGLPAIEEYDQSTDEKSSLRASNSNVEIYVDGSFEKVNGTDRPAQLPVLGPKESDDLDDEFTAYLNSSSTPTKLLDDSDFDLDGFDIDSELVGSTGDVDLDAELEALMS
jgi:hypothetical protein